MKEKNTGFGWWHILMDVMVMEVSGCAGVGCQLECQGEGEGRGRGAKKERAREKEGEMQSAWERTHSFP